MSAVDRVRAARRRPPRLPLGIAVLLVTVSATVGGCGQVLDPTPPSPSAGSVPRTASVGPSPSAVGPRAPTVTGSPAATPRPTVTASPTAETATAVPSPRCPSGVPAKLSLRGERGRALAFARVSDPGEVTVEGRALGAEAWSTSKVLVVAAFLDTTADGNPAAVGRANRRLIAEALQRSDGEAVRALRAQIPGSPGRAMTAVLREIGDDETVAPDTLEGTMPWSLREQVRFMAALDAGKVVSARTSDYLLEQMRPIRSHRWGLGQVGATAFKGGWLRQGRVTRQMGLLDGYAVAIITDRGPVELQSDGDAAHVAEMNRLAGILADRLAYEQECG